MKLKALPLIGVFLAAIVAANLITTHYGPSASIYNAFFLIGLDFITRDRLADLWGTKRISRMAVLILVGSGLSYLVNRDAATIALASCVAFAAAETVEALVYHALRHERWNDRAPRAALAAAAVDSLIFPWIAFGSVLWGITAGQFFAKLAGAVVWTWVVGYLMPSPRVAPEAA